MRNGKYADDHPRIRPNLVPLLRGAQKEMQVGLQELNQVLLANFGEGYCFIAIRCFQAVVV